MQSVVRLEEKTNWKLIKAKWVLCYAFVFCEVAASSCLDWKLKWNYTKTEYEHILWAISKSLSLCSNKQDYCGIHGPRNSKLAFLEGFLIIDRNAYEYLYNCLAFLKFKTITCFSGNLLQDVNNTCSLKVLIILSVQNMLIFLSLKLIHDMT